MLVVNRFRGEDLAEPLAEAAEVLAGRPGFVAAQIGRNLDDPTLWVLTTTWADVGSYRRALSSYDVKLGVVPLLSTAIDEPSAYENVDVAGHELNSNLPRDLG